VPKSIFSIETQVSRLAFSLADAASAIGVGKSTLHELIATGKLPVRKLGRRSLVLREDLEDYLQGLPVHGEQGAA
jgi:excisionase family DNA binding protein